MQLPPSASIPSSANSLSALRRSGHRTCAKSLRLLLMAGSAFAWIGCASFSGGIESPAVPDSTHADVDADRFEPAGPGAVFETVEAAAADALVYAYLSSRAERGSRADVRGGPIFPTEDGYSYHEPARSSDGATDRLRYLLRPEDVAHYRQFPASVRAGVMTGGGTLAASDRRVVDRADPLGRPIFYLTPKREMKVYLGSEAGDRALGRIGFGVLPGDTVVELTRLSPETSPMPLAAQGGMESAASAR